MEHFTTLEGASKIAQMQSKKLYAIQQLSAVTMQHDLDKVIELLNELRETLPSFAYAEAVSN